MRILFILHYPPPVHGAALMGKYIRESQIINEEFDCSYLNLGTSRSVKEIGKGGLKKWNRYFGLLITATIRIVRDRPNLIYITLTAKGGGFYKDFLVALLAKTLGVQVVFHFHNKGVREGQNNKIDDFLYKKIFKGSKVILLSEYLYPDIKKYVKRDQVYYCPNGIPDSRSEEVMKGNLINEHAEILFLSNLIETKGVYTLLDTCKLLKDKGVSFKCTLAGGEGDISKKQLQDKIEELCLSTNVQYVGKKFDNDKYQTFKKSDIFVHPTFDDCFPLVLLEAMQFSLPVISTEVGGIPEIVTHDKTGFLIKQGDSIALATKLELLIHNQKVRRELGEAGRNQYEERFRLEAFEKKFTEIITHILER